MTRWKERSSLDSLAEENNMDDFRSPMNVHGEAEVALYRFMHVERVRIGRTTRSTSSVVAAFAPGLMLRHMLANHRAKLVCRVLGVLCLFIGVGMLLYCVVDTAATMRSQRRARASSSSPQGNGIEGGKNEVEDPPPHGSDKGDGIGNGKSPLHPQPSSDKTVRDYGVQTEDEEEEEEEKEDEKQTRAEKDPNGNDFYASHSLDEGKLLLSPNQNDGNHKTLSPARRQSDGSIVPEIRTSSVKLHMAEEYTPPTHPTRKATARVIDSKDVTSSLHEVSNGFKEAVLVTQEVLSNKRRESFGTTPSPNVAQIAVKKLNRSRSSPSVTSSDAAALRKKLHAANKGDTGPSATDTSTSG